MFDKLIKINNKHYVKCKVFLFSFADNKTPIQTKRGKESK